MTSIRVVSRVVSDGAEADQHSGVEVIQLELSKDLSNKGILMSFIDN